MMVQSSDLTCLYGCVKKSSVWYVWVLGGAVVYVGVCAVRLNASAAYSTIRV